jgi:hypothetical protein
MRSHLQLEEATVLKVSEPSRRLSIAETGGGMLKLDGRFARLMRRRLLSKPRAGASIRIGAIVVTSPNEAATRFLGCDMHYHGRDNGDR